VNRKGVRPLYAHLTGEKRLRLGLQAGAAGDHAEAIHLLNGCPRVQGEGLDPSFTRPAMASAWPRPSPEGAVPT
jgi:hypothetical protein